MMNFVPTFRKYGTFDTKFEFRKKYKVQICTNLKKIILYKVYEDMTPKINCIIFSKISIIQEDFSNFSIFMRHVILK